MYLMRSMPLCRAAIACALWLSACTATTSDPVSVERAEFGVFFGGQVQEREEVPFVLDRSKQRLGFAITLKDPAPEPLVVQWEVSKPGPRRVPDTPSAPLGRRAELFEGMLATGQREFNQSLEFEPGDALGLWNVRVLVGNNVAIDRPFMVYDPARRRRKLAEAARLDGGL